MKTLLKTHGWLAIPLALAIFGTAAAVGGSGHDHGEAATTVPRSSSHQH